MPNMTTVEAIWPCCMGGRYRISQVSRKQMLQIKATREKNNSFCIDDAVNFMKKGHPRMKGMAFFMK